MEDGGWRTKDVAMPEKDMPEERQVKARTECAGRAQGRSRKYKGQSKGEKWKCRRRTLLVDLLQGLGQAPLQGQEQELFRVLEQERGLGQRQKQAEGLVLVLGLGRRPG